MWWALALAASPAVLAALGRGGDPSAETLRELARLRWTGLACGLALGLASALPAARLAARWTRRALLVLLFGATPLAAVELAAAPFFDAPAPIFVPDAALGWRLRPGIDAEWFGAPVSINAAGLRGAPPANPRVPGAERVLVLGDSVVFGFRIGEGEGTLPERLQADLRAATGRPVEVLNAGVGGWSPWQEDAWLRARGDELAPDVVILGFVLNDVVEKLSLERFGGDEVSFQLRHARPTGVAGWVRATAWYALVHELAARLRGERSAREGAQERELLSVYDLMLRPDDADVAQAWDLTLPNVASVAAWCRERGVKFLVTVFPYTIQLEDPDARRWDAPQRRLAAALREQGVALVDPLPALRAAMRREGWTQYDVYLDAVHPSPLGDRVFAEQLSAELLGRGWIAR